MIAEIGNIALILAFLLGIIFGVVPIYGAAKNNSALAGIAIPATRIQFLFVLIAYVCLTYSFVISDFSIAYVANNSNSKLPLIYRISGVWGAHEGSLLLWALILSLWTILVSIFSRNVPKMMIARVLGVMGLISVGFLAFILFTSNPFDRLFPSPLEGQDLNPLLQDFGLAIHPPMLYMGYVGFSVAFAFAVAALLSGRLDAAWTRWMRPWCNIAWMFLTIGIGLGSWWAYYELGWGGWWFWDPVENASFMPWLVGTALIHSLAATEKRDVFKAWTVLLAVSAFSLSLLGTFLVRSGVLTSVHAFASDPERGLFILIFLLIVVGGSLALYAWRAPQLTSTGKFEPVSRESALLVNNILLVSTAGCILLGTLFPLFMDALGLGKYSVGAPYFNKVFIPLMAPLSLLMAFGALSRWKRDSIGRIGRLTIIALVCSVTLGLVFPLIGQGHYSFYASLGLILGFWVIFSNLEAIAARMQHRWKPSILASAPISFYGMVVAHIGIGVFIIGVTMVSAYEVEHDISMIPGDEYSVGEYYFKFNGVADYTGQNYSAQRGEIEITRGNENRVPVATLSPEKRQYAAQGNTMTEAAIDPSITRDLYVSLGEPLGGESWAVRIYYKPYIRLIWLGVLIMGFGGLLGALDARYRRSYTVKKTNRVSVTQP